MADINIAPFMGAIVMNGAAWRSIPEKYKPELIRITKKMELELDTSIQKLEEDIIVTMEQYGLVINRPTPAQEQLWNDDGNRAVPTLLGSTFDRTVYRRIEAILEKRRAAPQAAN
jgi:TRAP-type C4-dicarboxylate transport system substrate-binding protein